ncbi:MAG: hypothetical protein E7773_11370 [Sphingomonas sp.]|uniref:hypothetical protein n=1 Tax=Sphingomonas sp. TaxID=28214 RepID=UPI0011FF50DC|nr:hypothetical protein [Sphingomonas sp.]THD35057.1 MAG: hypothetical protein E7773_11370 [Sphingomonas sp.]
MSTARRLEAAVVPWSLDAPTALDRRRIRSARRMALGRYREIEAARDAALNDALRAELAATVRSASPLLVSMLELQGLALDEAVMLLRPQFGWPARPRLSGPSVGRHLRSHPLRYYHSATRPSQFSQRPPAQMSQPPLFSRMFDRADGGYFTLQLVDHSLEIEAKIGPVTIETRFGELSIELGSEMPETIFAALVGRPLDEIVEYEAWRGRGWRIAATVEEEFPFDRRLIVMTGSAKYVMPWAR